MKDRDGYAQRAIPIKIFGDGVCVLGMGKSWGKTVNALTMCGLLNRNSSALAHMLLMLTWKKTSTNETVHKAWRVLSWSLECCFKGTFPAKDWTGTDWPADSPEAMEVGQELAGGFFLTTVAVTGDIEYHYDGYKGPHWNSASPCMKCACTSDQNRSPWTDCKMSAQWREQVYDAEQFQNKFPEAISLFFQSCCCINQLHFDLMHTKWLGTDQSMLASWIAYVISRKRIGLKALWRRINETYKETLPEPCSFGSNLCLKPPNPEFLWDHLSFWG